MPAKSVGTQIGIVVTELSDEATEEVSGGMAGHGLGSIRHDNHVRWV